MARVVYNQLPEPSKRGQVHPKDYWNDEYFKELQPLVAALHEEVADAKYDAKALVFMLVQLLHFQEAAFGKDAMPPRMMTKLPIKLLSDPSVGGALHAIALKLHDIKRSRGLKAIEWQNPGKRKECLEVVMVLRRELERRRLLQVPHVHVSPTNGSEMQRLREYVRRLQGQLAEAPDEPGVTHIVYPFGPKGDPDDGNEYTSLIAVKGDKARVHYWYQPDSYDEWIPLDSVDSKEVVKDRSPPGGVWKVTPRWIIDSERYNEWMNPADYTTPEQDAEMDAAEEADAKGMKRPGTSLTGQAKKAKGADGGKLEVDPEPLQVLGPTAVLRRVLSPHKGTADNRFTVENISQGQLNNHLAAYQQPLPPPAQQPTPAAAAAGGDAGAAAQQQQPDKQQQDGAPPAPAAAAAAAVGSSGSSRRGGGGVAYIPASAGWFKPNTVHAIERAAVPEFFSGCSGGSSLALYRQYRDTMLGLFLEAPDKDLSLAEVRQHIDGEANAITRIYNFLVDWGLLNCREGGGVTAPHLPLSLTGPTGLSAHLPPGTACLYQFKHPSRLESTAAAQAGGPLGSAAAAAARGDGSRLLTPAPGRRNADEGMRPSCLNRIHCSAMPWVDCTTLRYHCTKLPDVNLCPQAYAEGRFPPGCSSKDFVRIDDVQRHNSSDGWRPEETMLLLEAVEQCKDDWAAVAAHVGTRSQAACLAHFVRLPIEDPFIEELTRWGETQQHQQQQLPPLPFQDEPNPLLSMLGVLAVVMGPKVAAAAAQRALQVLAEGDMAAAAELAPAARLAAVKKAAAAAAAAAAATAAAAAGQQDGPDGQAAEAASTAMEIDQQQQPQENGHPPPPADVAVDPGRPIDKPLLLSAVAAGLAAAATRAKQLASHEEREIQRLMVGLVDAAAKKVEAKLALLQQLMEVQVLERERVQSESSIKPLQAEYTTLSEKLKQTQLLLQQRAAAAQQAAKQKAEAAAKQQQVQQKQKQQQQKPAIASPTVQPKQQQQQPQQGQQPATTTGAQGANHEPNAAATAATAAAVAAVGDEDAASPGPSQQQPHQQLSQQTPAKSDSRQPESSLMDDDFMDEEDEEGDGDGFDDDGDADMP